MNQKTLILLWIVMFVLSQSVVAQGTDDPIDQAEKKQVVEAVSQQLNDNYIFPEVAEKMADSIKRKLRRGAYKKINNAMAFAEQLTTDLVAVSDDKHLRVMFNPAAIAAQQEAITPEDEQRLRDQYINSQRLGNFGFNEVKIMEGNIGYLDLRSFADPSFAGNTAVAAMNFLSNTDALIIDLRQNGGGSPQMIQLISSYLFGEEPVHLNSFYHRPEDRHSQTWTLPHVSGKRNPDVPVYVLTSNRTFSAAEEFSYNLRNLERATLVGETTGGGAHPGGTQIATDRFQIWVPTGRAINPITNTNWEGVGVEPHMAVEQAMALSTAYAEALKTLIKNNQDEQAQAVYQWVLDGIQAENQVVELTAALMQSYAGQYGPRMVTMNNSDLYYQRGEGNQYKLIPMGEHKFMIKEIPYFRIQFEMQDDQAVALVGHYNNGRTDKNLRD